MSERLLHIRAGFPFTIEVQIKDEEWLSGQTNELKKALVKLTQHESELRCHTEKLLVYYER